MNLPKDAISILRCAGEQGDDSLDLAEIALALAALEYPQASLTSYLDHLAVLVEQIRAEGPVSCLDDRLRVLRRVLVVQNKYHGDEDSYDDPHGANLMRVIDRRRGLPVALGIIYLHVAEKLGWPMTGLNFPGSFLVRLSAADGRAILDPFRAGKTCSPEDLQELLPAKGQDVLEQTPRYGAPVSKRDVLLRLQNNIKRRQLGLDNLDAAINTLQGMVLFAPHRHEVWRELGYLQAERGHLRSAITALEVVCDLTGDVMQAQQTETVLGQLRRQLN